MDQISEAAFFESHQNEYYQPPEHYGEAPKAISLVIYSVIHTVDIKRFKVKLKFQRKDQKRIFSICWYRLYSMSPAASRYLGMGGLAESGTAVLWIQRHAEPRLPH